MEPVSYPPPTPAYPYPQLPKKGISKWLIAAIVAGVLVLGCCGLGVVGLLIGADEDANESVETSGASSPSSEPTSEPAPTETSSEPADECEQYDDVTSDGRPLCEFRDSPSYEYRLNLAKTVDEVLPRVQEIAPWTEAANLTDLYGTCDDVANDSERLIENAVLRFSAGPSEQVTEAQAQQLVDIATEYICP